MLKAGKQVIFWAQPREDFPENPFSFGAHYVMAVGYTEGGEILIANSSKRKAPSSVQTVDIGTVAKALYLDTDPTDKTWGEKGDHIHCAGYVVVG